MAYDPVRKQVILFGGWNADIYDDTWAWDGKIWYRLTPQTSPSPRFYHRMVHDAERGEIVLFGGLGTSAANDTWIWNGTSWTRKIPATSPPERLAACGGTLENWQRQFRCNERLITPTRCRKAPVTSTMASAIVSHEL